MLPRVCCQGCIWVYLPWLYFDGEGDGENDGEGDSEGDDEGDDEVERGGGSGGGIPDFWQISCQVGLPLAHLWMQMALPSTTVVEISPNNNNIDVYESPSEIINSGSKLSFSGNLVVCKPNPFILDSLRRSTASFTPNLAQAGVGAASVVLVGTVYESDGQSTCSILLFP